ncbi:MAG: DUF4340 domain-containing protein [Deltaproteobacteria bacterium]|nr:DUF4340 domain-containing protein [Deltaproteobacteria bacterium]
MKIKKEYLLLVVIIVALAAYLVSRNPDRNLYELPQMDSVLEKDIRKIELTSSDGKILFAKEGSDWKIAPENYLADSQKVKEMLSVIERLTLTELISESKNYKRYNLDPAEGIKVMCWAKDNLRRQFTIGKSAGSFSHTFVKLPGNDAVYQARGDFRKKFDMEKGGFRDKSVLSFEKNDIVEFEIQTGESREKFKKKIVPQETESKEIKDPGASAPPSEPLWTDSKGGAADVAMVSGTLSTLSDLKCEMFLEGKTKADFSNPVYKITFKGLKVYTLSIYAEVDKDGESYFPAVSSENNYPFILTKWRAENIMKKPGELIKKLDSD